MTHDDYWLEAVRAAIEDFSLTIEDDDIRSLAESMQVAHDQFSMAFGCDVADKNLGAAKDDEMKALRRELRDKQDEVDTLEHSVPHVRNDGWRRGWKGGFNEAREQFEVIE